MKWPTCRLVSAVAAIVIAACAASSLASQSLPPISELNVIDNAGTTGRRCDARHVAERLGRLFNAISQGEPGIAEEYFGYGRGGPFRWFSFTEFYAEPREHYVTYSLDNLNGHFAARRAAGQHMRLRGVTFNRLDDLLHFGPVDFDLVTPGSVGATRIVYSGTGKGAYHCPTEAFVVLSLTAGGQASGWSPF